MMYGNCKLCKKQDDYDYLHPLYDGKGDNFVMICEDCRSEIFSDHERSKREDSEVEKFINKIKFGWIEETLEMRCSEHDGNVVKEVQ